MALCVKPACLAGFGEAGSAEGLRPSGEPRITDEVAGLLILACAYVHSLSPLSSSVFWRRPRAQTRTIGIDEVRPGMVGVGRTVFAGDTLEDFKVHILGVLRNVVAPKRDLVLARLEGGPLAKTGVIAGMSGSPVYIDGRLLGAVSYALGQFATEPIAGITPIARDDRRHRDAGTHAGRAAGGDCVAGDAA